MLDLNRDAYLLNNGMISLGTTKPFFSSLALCFWCLCMNGLVWYT